MTEENTQQPSLRGKSRRERVEHARSRDILDVANELHMELVRSGRDYRWKEHDSMVISPDKNMWNWFSRHQGGDVISLVQTMKEINFNQAIDYLNDGAFKEFATAERVQESFNYYLKPYEQPFEAARNYLKDQRGLSDETIDFFLEKGVLAQANAKVNGSIEPVVVFKSFDFSGEIVGATLQGIEENWEKWPERGYAKNIVRHSDGITGIHIDIGQPNRLIFAESAIDLMSYYELNKDNLQDVRLISMDGLKEGVIGRHLAQLQSDVSGRPLRWNHDELAEGLQIAIDNNFFADGKHVDWITLAVDNDEAGRTFIDSLQEKGAIVISDLPELQSNQEKMDWNDFLQQEKTAQHSALKEAKLDNSHLAQAERKLERLNRELDTRANNVYDHIRQANEHPKIEIVFHSSDEPLLSQYSSGDVIPYTEFVNILYPENAKLFKGNPRTGPTVSLSDTGGTWFGLRTADGQMLVERFRYDVGLEGESISDRLNGILSSIHLEQIRRIDATFDTPSYIKENHDIGIEVKLYSNQEYIDTLDFNDLFNHTNLEMMANELGHTDLLNPIKTYTVTIAGVSLNQDQVDILVNRMIEEGLETSSLKQLLEREEFTFEQYIEQGKVSQGLDIESQSYVAPKQKKKFPDEERIVTYSELRRENEELVNRLENRIKVGDLAISFDTDVYLYDVFENLGNSHPLKYITNKRLEVLAPLRPILASINDKTVDLYKNKGTVEQDSLYQALKPHQRTLGVDISTRFIGELAIAAYSTNKQLESLSAEQFGFYYGARTFDNLSQSIERMLEYPLNEAGIKDYTYGFVTTPNSFYHYLMEQEGEVVLSRSELEMLMSRIESQSYQIVEPIQEEIAVSEAKEKSLEMNQETNTGGELLNRNSSFLGEESPGTAPQPVEQLAQPDFPANVHLHFTTDEGNMSNKSFRKNLRTLNLYSNTVRDSAQWYLSEMSGATMSYVYKTAQHEEVQVLNVRFDKKNWMHLTGITPVYENWVESLSEQFIEDVSRGNGHFRNLKFAPGTADKLKVLNLLPEIVESDTFVFNDLSSVEKFHNLDLSQALNPEDTDLLLLFKGEGEYRVPASLMRIKGEMVEQLSNIENGTVLGVYREKGGQIEQLSINEEYVKDGGQEMLSILENKQYEEALIPNQDNNDKISAELFTQVLDAAYNVGDPRKLGTQVPEESKVAWERYYELSDKHEGNFGVVVSAADQMGLIDKDSNFYREWSQDRIYNETYHVRLQRAETWPDGPQIPFKETELVEYQTFAEELYNQNRAFYERHQESLATGNQVDYIPFTKVKFDVYAPGGTLIKSDVRYDIGDEAEPISRLLGLGYRRLEGQPELAAIDEIVLSQLENQAVNQEIAAEANEQHLKTPEVLPDEDSSSRGSFRSPNQEIKAGLSQRIEEIMAEDATKILVSSIPQIQENLSVEGNLVGTLQAGNRMLYTNREDFGQDYQLELSVHSPAEIDNLSDTQALWTLSLIKGEKQLGYLAYGGDWGNDFQIEEELERLVTQIGSGKIPEGLYKQAEVDAFLANHLENEKSQESIPTVVTEPFDYTSASAYEISEHAFQKIREYTQSPEDLLEYMDFMSKFPQLSPRNVALIHEQWRGANAVATYDQWQAMGETLGIKPEDVIQTKAIYTNKRTGETKEVVHQGLSVKTGEKSQITLFRPLMAKMIPVLDEHGHQIKNDKGNPKFKKLSEATPQEKALVKEGKLSVRQFQERDPKTGYPRFTTYKVFELSQTTLRPESYPKAMPNRHYNFNVDKVKTKEVLEGLCDYADSIGIKMMKDEAHVLGNAKGAFFPDKQIILINPDNTPGEKIATTIHELAHATLHNPKLVDQYKEPPKGQKELEAEMTSHILAKHFGLDTSEKAINYMAKWTGNLKTLDDKQLADSLKRVHKTVSKMLKQVESHTKPYQIGKNRGQVPNFPKPPTKGPIR